MPLKVFSDIHLNVQNRLEQSKATMTSQQHKRSSPIHIQPGDSVMVRVPERSSKLSPKFVGPRLVTKHVSVNKFEIFDPLLHTLEVVHCDRLKKTNARPDLSLVDTATLSGATRLGTDMSSPSTNTPPTHNYNLRPRH